MCPCASGVVVLAVGVGRVNTEELLGAVTDSSSQNLLQARDGDDLYRLQAELAELLCGIARGSVVPVRHPLRLSLFPFLSLSLFKLGQLQEFCSDTETKPCACHVL